MLAAVFAMVFAMLVDVANAQRPVDLPSGLPCSAAEADGSYQLPVGNAGVATYSLFYLGTAASGCGENAVNSIPVSGTVYVASFVGRSWYARDPAGRIIDTFVASSKTLNWYLQVNLHPSSTNLSQPSSTDPSASAEQSKLNQPSANLGLILGLTIPLAFLLLALSLMLAQRYRSVTKVRVKGVYTVVKGHFGSLEDEISVDVGERCEVRAMYDDGWVNVVCGERVGMIPGGCLIAKK